MALGDSISGAETSGALSPRRPGVTRGPGPVSGRQRAQASPGRVRTGILQGTNPETTHARRKKRAPKWGPGPDSELASVARHWTAQTARPSLPAVDSPGRRDPRLGTAAAGEPALRGEADVRGSRETAWAGGRQRPCDLDLPPEARRRRKRGCGAGCGPERCLLGQSPRTRCQRPLVERSSNSDSGWVWDTFSQRQSGIREVAFCLF